MKALFKLIAVVLYFAFFVGFLLPFLFSAKSTIAFGLGVLAVILTIVAGFWYFQKFLSINTGTDHPDFK